MKIVVVVVIVVVFVRVLVRVVVILVLDVVILAGEFLRECKPYIEEGVHPQSIVKAFRTACNIALKQLDAIAVKLDELTGEKRREMLEKAAATSLSSRNPLPFESYSWNFA